MQTAGAKTGMAGSSSLLLHSLRVYLNNQNRLQPIIGLTSVTECVKAGPGGDEVLYLCDVCACRVSKADIRSHIMGSLHRCNYIKVCHPYIMGGREVTDLSKLAWPLMDLARLLEKQEGPGDVQVMEMDPAAYKMMASLSGSEARSFLHAVKDGRWAQLYSSVQSAYSLEALTQSQKPSVDFTQSQMLSVDFSQPQTLSVDFTHSQKQSVDFTPSFEMTRSPAPTWMTPATGQWENSVMLPGTYQMPLKPPGQSEHSNVFLHGYTDTNPIIGLDRVVECRGEEDGRSHCFLCHSCRVKTLHDGIIHHLTSSSHYYNYMVEMQPECEGAMRNCYRHLYLSMAQTVEQQDGRGQVKVKWLPTSLCSQLTGNSYHWCIKKLGDGNVWTPADKQTTRWSIQGPSDGTAEASGTGGTQEHAGEKSRQGRKRKSENNPVFKVSLPLNYGPLVLERTSFSLDALPVLPPADPTPPSPSPEPHQEYISGPLFIDQPDDFCEDSDALAEGQHNLFGADTDRLAEVQELQHELFGTDTVAEERELQNELFGGDPDTLAEEDQHEEQYWNSWDTSGHQEPRDGYFTDRHY